MALRRYGCRSGSRSWRRRAARRRVGGQCSGGRAPPRDGARTGEDGRLDELHELVDLDEHRDRHFEVGAACAIRSLPSQPSFSTTREWEATKRYAQDLQERARLLVRLGKEAQREGRDRVVRPRAVQRHEEVLAVLHSGSPSPSAATRSLQKGGMKAHLGVERAQPLAEVAQLGRGDHDEVEVLDHDARKLEVLQRSTVPVRERLSPRGEPQLREGGTGGRAPRPSRGSRRTSCRCARRSSSRTAGE